MPALSSFYTFLSGASEICNNNFTENVDYVLSGNSLFINLSSDKWSDISVISTTLCALDLVDVRPFSSIALKVSGSSQPYLSTGAFFYNVGTGTGFISCRCWGARTFPIYDLNFLYFGFSEICDTINIFGKFLEVFAITNNNSLTGIEISPVCSLSALNTLAILNCQSLKMNSLESLINNLASNTQTTGYLSLGVSANATANLASSINTLTSTKGWSYIF